MDNLLPALFKTGEHYKAKKIVFVTNTKKIVTLMHPAGQKAEASEEMVVHIYYLFSTDHGGYTMSTHLC